MASAKFKTVRGLKIFRKKHRAIVKLQTQRDSPEIHGDKVWFSSYFIMDYLLKNPIAKKSRIMEIGCGWGLLSIFCAKEFKAKVTAVDADRNVFPYLKLHARKNKVKVKTKLSKYEKLSVKSLAELDLITGGDICFWDELVSPLYKLIKRAVQHGVKKIIIADPGRTPFLKLAKRCKRKFHAELIPCKIKDPVRKKGYLLVISNQLP